jgi:glycosyltransferase involved in cell wall biosynthesis
MRIMGFVEGAMTNKGGVGLVGVPGFLCGTAARGHQVALVVGGPPIFGREHLLTATLDDALVRKEGAGTFGMVAFRSLQQWAFAPSILWRARRYVRSADFVSLHSLYSFPVFAGYLLARWYKKPYAFWPHGVLAAFQTTVSAGKKGLYDRLIARRIVQNANLVIYAAKGEGEEAQQAYVVAAGDTRPRSVIVPDGFDPTPYEFLPPRGEFRKKYLGGHTGPFVLFLARLNAKKGLKVLCQAMGEVIKKRPDARLVIVGPADPAAFEGQVRDWVRENGIESQTVLTGKVDFPTKLQAFADADIYVLPSEAENFGFSVFEAMACRIPVVVSKNLYYGAEITSSRAGIALDRDPGLFAAAIIELLADPHMRASMGENGFLMARRYSLEETARKLETSLDCILHNRPLPAEVVLT